MPIYEYRCKKCGNDFEDIVGANAPAPPCPACHGEKVEKLLSKASFRTASASGCDAGSCDPGSCGSGGACASSGGCAGCAGGNCAACH
ncbi:MAG: zinc ribbon domain-containing protein [Deltaproteobacteria bacterium]|nr:zinc ribbon domain-containing protein [Deltaproteobacteria bacterium]